MTPAQLLDGAQAVADRAPDAELVKNEVGNLAIVRNGAYIGFLNLRNGELELIEDDPANG